MSTRLPDTDQYVERIEVKSETTDKLYVVSRRRGSTKRECSCMAGKRYKRCKHIAAVNLELGATKKNSFTEGYKTYDGPRGSAEDWRNAARTLKHSDGDNDPLGGKRRIKI